MSIRTQSQNEPASLGWAESLNSKNVGYHSTHDFGGAKGMNEIFFATDGLVVSCTSRFLTERIRRSRSQHTSFLLSFPEYQSW